jgi:hypothetical protein
MAGPDLVGDLARLLTRPASGSDGSGDPYKFKADGKTDQEALDLASGVPDRSPKQADNPN